MFFYVVQLVGTFFFAVSGALSGYKKNFDLTGVMLIAFAVGNGGGTIRDLLIGTTPVFWMQDPLYIVLTLVTGFIVFFIAEHVNVSTTAFLIADALGLGVFAIVGAQKTLDVGLSPLVAVMMGALSAVGGGVIRDILSGETPLIFKPEIYSTAAIAGAIVFVILHAWCPDIKHIAGLACAFTVIAIRLATLKWHWVVPTPNWLDARRQRKKY